MVRKNTLDESIGGIELPLPARSPCHFGFPYKILTSYLQIYTTPYISLHGKKKQSFTFLTVSNNSTYPSYTIQKTPSYACVEVGKTPVTLSEKLGFLSFLSTFWEILSIVVYGIFFNVSLFSIIRLPAPVFWPSLRQERRPLVLHEESICILLSSSRSSGPPRQV